MAFLRKIKLENLDFQGASRNFYTEAAKTTFFPIFSVNFNQMASFYVSKHPGGGFQSVLRLRSWSKDAGNLILDNTSIFWKIDFWAGTLQKSVQKLIKR